jgi:hypothetical protein
MHLRGSKSLSSLSWRDHFFAFGTVHMAGAWARHGEEPSAHRGRRLSLVPGGGFPQAAVTETQLPGLRRLVDVSDASWEADGGVQGTADTGERKAFGDFNRSAVTASKILQILL